MATVKNKRYGKVERGDRIPYGTLANASPELRQAYYSYGYLHDYDMPPIPCPPPDLSGSYVCPEEELFKKEMVEIVATALDTLKPRAANTLRMRFGFDGGYDMTLEEVGRSLDVTKERIRQIEAKALRSLKHPSRSGPLRELVEPTCEEDKIIEFNAARAKRPASSLRNEDIRTIKHKIVWAHEEKDEEWVTYFKCAEPELYAEFEKRVRSKTEIYQWLKSHGLTAA